MAQYDLLLTQNTAASGIEFEEKYINLGDKELLVGGAAGALAKIAKADAVGKILKSTNADGTFSWGANDGTPESIFAIDSDGHNIKLKAESATKLGLRNAADNAYVSLELGTVKADQVDLKIGANTVSVAAASITHNSTPENGMRLWVDGGHGLFQAKRVLATIETPIEDLELTTKGWVEDQIAASFGANDAMVFKGTVGSGGTHTIAAFNALATYQAGWTYRVIEAGTVKGKVCEIGDLVIALVDRAGSGNVDADWTVAQTNIDGAVTAAANFVADQLVVGGGANKTTKVLPAGTAGQILKMVGTTPIPTWSNESPGFINPMDSVGDLIIGGTAGAASKLDKGAQGKVLKVGATTLEWLDDIGFANPMEAAGDIIKGGSGGAPVKMVKGSAGQVLAVNGGETDIEWKTLTPSVIGARKAWVTAPSGAGWATASGAAGDEAYDANFYYIWVASNTVRRRALAK